MPACLADMASQSVSVRQIHSMEDISVLYELSNFSAVFPSMLEYRCLRLILPFTVISNFALHKKYVFRYGKLT